MTSTLETVAEVARDRWGRPLIIPPGGGKPVPYTRASTLGKTLEEQSALTAWKQRMTLVGVTLAPHIALSAAAHRDDRDKLNSLAQDALTAAQAHGRAEIGTALHKILETIDAGRDPGPFPAEWAADVAAYRAATAGWQYAAAEAFVVCDALQVAGTFDRLRVLSTPVVNGPAVRIGDLKTGSSVEYAWLSIAVQLAVYANSELYDPATGQRRPLASLLPGAPQGAICDKTAAEVVWLPAGEGRCEVYEVDILAGWKAAQLAVEVRNARKGAKKWVTKADVVVPTLADTIAAAPTVEALGRIWSTRKDEFDADLQALAKARHAVLAGGAA